MAPTLGRSSSSELFTRQTVRATDWPPRETCLEFGRNGRRGPSRKCATWRISASRFWRKATLKRRQCDTVLAQSDGRIAVTAKKHERRRLSVAHPCTEVAHGVHSPRDGRSATNRVGPLFCGEPTCSRVRQDRLHAWDWLSSDTCQNPMPRNFGGTRTQTIPSPSSRAIVLTQTHAAHAWSAIAIHAARPHGMAGTPPPLQDVAGPAFSTVRDPVKQRLTRGLNVRDHRHLRVLRWP